jgi:Flp pilus assembly protein TadB
MEQTIEKDLLYIPQGLKKKREFFEGYGWYEFGITIFSCFAALFICVVLYLLTQNIVLAVLLFLILPSTTVLMIVRNDSNISVVSQIGFMVRFAREQKKYPYRYRDELAYEFD